MDESQSFLVFLTINRSRGLKKDFRKQLCLIRCGRLHLRTINQSSNISRYTLRKLSAIRGNQHIHQFEFKSSHSHNAALVEEAPRYLPMKNLSDNRENYLIRQSAFKFKKKAMEQTKQHNQNLPVENRSLQNID